MMMMMMSYFKFTLLLAYVRNGCLLMMDILDSSFVSVLLIILPLVILTVYLYLKRKYSYWEKRGVPYFPPESLIFGSAKHLLFFKQCGAVLYDEIYRQFEGKPYCGFYEFQYPILLLRDPQLIQTVMVEHFNSFHDNKFGLGVNPKGDEFLSLNPFVLHGSRWKEVRSMLIPGLTLNKLKILEDIIKQVDHNLKKFLEKNPGDIEAYSLASKFTSEMVANFGWGISSGGFSDDTTFSDMFNKVDLSATGSALMFLNPFLSYWLKARIFGKDFCEFLKDVTNQCIKNIESNKTSQPTFLQTVLNIREKLKLTGKDMSLSEITGFMSALYLDGYETAGRTLSNIMYCLMLNPDVQHKLREEINNVTEEVTVDSVNKLEYMDMVILEAMRLYSVVPNITRVCTEKCKLGELEVEVGTRILIPSHSIHHDPKYYKDAETFNPENFSEENKSNRHKSTFFGFGQGPRTCLGIRYAATAMKLFLFYLLKDYEIVPPTNHPINHIKPDPRSAFVFIPKDPTYIKLKKLKN